MFIIYPNTFNGDVIIFRCWWLIKKMKNRYFVLLWKIIVLRIIPTKFIFFHTLGGVRIRISEEAKSDRDKVSLNQMIIRLHNTFLYEKYLAKWWWLIKKMKNCYFVLLGIIMILWFVRIQFRIFHTLGGVRIRKIKWDRDRI